MKGKPFLMEFNPEQTLEYWISLLCKQNLKRLCKLLKGLISVPDDIVGQVMLHIPGAA